MTAFSSNHGKNKLQKREREESDKCPIVCPIKNHAWPQILDKGNFDKYFFL